MRRHRAPSGQSHERFRNAARAQEGSPTRAVLLDEQISETQGMVVSLGTATLRRGKPKHLLLIDVRLEVTSVLGDSLGLISAILVNGHVVSSGPGQPADTQLCSEFTSCAAGASAWLDLDEAELDYPGEFKGQPLEIEVQGRAESSDIAPSFRLRVLGQLVKK